MAKKSDMGIAVIPR